jgi:hypothetical protein
MEFECGLHSHNYRSAIWSSAGDLLKSHLDHSHTPPAHLTHIMNYLIKAYIIVPPTLIAKQTYDQSHTDTLK